MSERPFALLAFSFDPLQPLPGVAQELHRINDTFRTCHSVPITLWSASQTNIEESFQQYHRSIRIFHFSGHAGQGRLQTNFMGKPRYTFAEGLSKNIGLFGKGLRLVFLNGCSTKEQVDFFLQNGIPAVIATRKPVADQYACFFARLFYEKFIGSNLPLAMAFDAARHSFDADGDHGNFCDRRERNINLKFLDEKFRSVGFRPDHDDSPEIYDLHTQTSDAQVLTETFAEWFPPTGHDVITGKESDPGKLNTGKKDEKGYLKCDRDAPMKAFHQMIVAKTAQPCQMVEPRFFIICEAERHCPQLLPDRFERYSLRELFKAQQITLNPDQAANCFKELRLPEPKDFEADEATGAFNDHYKIALAQIYHDEFGGTPPGDHALGQLNPSPEPLLVISHRLQHSDWIGPEKQPKLAALLRHYIGAFANDLQAQLTERLIVVFYLPLIKKDPTLQDELFPTLAREFRGQVEVITKLPELDWGHVQAWERDFLGVADNTFLDIGKIFTVPDETTSQMEEEPRESLPFKTIIGKLQNEIRRFNTHQSNAQR